MSSASAVKMARGPSGSSVRDSVNQEFAQFLSEANLAPLAAEVGLLPSHSTELNFTTPPRAPPRHSRLTDQKLIIGTPGSLTPSAVSSPQTPVTHVPVTPKSSAKAATTPRGRKRLADSPADTPRKASKRQKMSEKEKNGKGLRHFSMRVCNKVKDKGVTTYNEVADELVLEQQRAEEEAAARGEDLDHGNEPHGPKNIRRRVYDALNVLMAMNIISKEKKEIRWIGLPNSSASEFTHLEDLRAKKVERIEKKAAHLQELIQQQIAFKNLVKKNELEFQGQPAPHNALHLPFIIVNTPKQTVIDCQMAEDKSEYFFDFNMPFEIHDDIEVLKRMGLAYGLERGACKPEDLAEAERLIPKALKPYLLALAQGGGVSLTQESLAGPAVAGSNMPMNADDEVDDEEDDEEDDGEDDDDDEEDESD